MKPNYGPKIKGTTLQYHSSSGLELAKRCNLKWWLRYVKKIREPSTAAMSGGVEVHSQIDIYGRTGKNVLGRIARTALPYIPKNSTVQFEKEIDGSGLLLAGTKVVGKVDLNHDETKTIGEVLDWKTTGNIDRKVLLPNDLLNSCQMPIYGKWKLNQGNFEQIRLSHVYLQTKGAAKSKKATELHDVAIIETRWDQLSILAKTVQDLPKEQDQSKIPFNTKACMDWGRMCHYRVEGNCTANDSDSVYHLLGVEPPQPQKEIMTTSLLDQIQIGTDTAEVSALPKKRPEGFDALYMELRSMGMGMPVFGDEMAELVSSYTELPIVGGVIPGNGTIGKIPVNTLKQFTTETMPQLREYLSTQKQEVVTPVIENPLIPPETVQIVAPEPTAEPITESEVAETAATLDNVKGPAKAYVVAAKAAMETLRKPKCGKVERLAAVDVIEKALTDRFTFHTNATIVQPEKTPASKPTVYLNCRPHKKSCENLYPRILELAAEVANKTNCTDIRISDHKALDYGKWKATLSLAIQQTLKLDADHYLIGGTDFADAAIDALRTMDVDLVGVL